jgi:hypothetical protein
MKKLDSVSLILCDSDNEIDAAHCSAWGLTPDNAHNWSDAADPDSEGYWDAWAYVLDNARFVHDGDTYTLYQDGDLWALCVERMSEEEKTNFGFDQ